MLLSELNVGTPVSIKATEKNKSLEFGTEVIGKEDNALRLAVIKEGDAVINFCSEKVKLSLLVNDEGKLLDFENIQIYNKKYDGETVHIVFGPSESVIYNRRKTPRFPVNKVCIFSLGEHRKTEDALLHDISMTGIGIVSHEKVRVGDTVRIAFSPNADRTQIILAAKVVRVEELDDKSKYFYGCELLKENSALNRYIMDIQREKRKLEPNNH